MKGQACLAILGFGPALLGEAFFDAAPDFVRRLCSGLRSDFLSKRRRCEGGKWEGVKREAAEGWVVHLSLH